METIAIENFEDALNENKEPIKTQRIESPYPNIPNKVEYPGRHSLQPQPLVRLNAIQTPKIERLEKIETIDTEVADLSQKENVN